MKILHIVNELKGGTAGVVAKIIADNKKRHVISAIVTGNQNIPLKKISICYHIPLIRNINLLKDWQAYRALTKIIVEFKPDIIHCHCAKAGILGRLAAKFYKIPACYSPHGYAFLRTDVSAITAKFYYWLEKIIARFTGALTIACGTYEYDIAQNFSSVILIQNSVELTKISSQETQNLIVTIGRVTTQKGIDEYIEIVRQAPGTWRWLWIGDGQQREKLAQLSNVTITGWIPHEQVIKLLATATVYLQTSLWEGLPLSVLEAMSLAKPVVCRNIKAYYGLIEPNQNGLLFYTTAEAVSQIANLLEDKVWRNQIAEAAQKTIYEQFNAAENIPEYFKCYQKLLS